MVELCSCLGIQLIQIALKSNKQVVGVDINKNLVGKANKNAKIYKVKNVKFIVGDALNESLLKSLSAEVVIMDPHWSVTRTLQRDFAKTTKDTSPPVNELIRLTRKYITNNIIVELPPTISDKELLQLGDCEIQDVYINGERKQKFAYYGDMKQTDRSKVKFEFVKGFVAKKLREKLVM